jgi:hypothetical protein
VEIQPELTNFTGGDFPIEEFQLLELSQTPFNIYVSMVFLNSKHMTAEGHELDEFYSLNPKF